MEIGTLLTILALTLASAAFLAQPLLDTSRAPEDEPGRIASGIPVLEYSLQENSHRLKELEADLADHKIDRDGFQTQQKQLQEQRTRIQEELHTVQQYPLETAVRDMRTRLDAGTTTETLTCPSCGEKVGQWKFCPSCGNPLPEKEAS